MDINKLLYQHQLALMNADNASTEQDQQVYCDLADHYSNRIRQYRQDHGLVQY